MDASNDAIRYQIPSDLLSWDGAMNASRGNKLKTVKRYVAAIFKMLDKAKAEELEEEAKRYKKAQPEVMMSDTYRSATHWSPKYPVDVHSHYNGGGRRSGRGRGRGHFNGGGRRSGSGRGRGRGGDRRDNYNSQPRSGTFTNGRRSSSNRSSNRRGQRLQQSFNDTSVQYSSYSRASLNGRNNSTSGLNTTTTAVPTWTETTTSSSAAPPVFEPQTDDDDETATFSSASFASSLSNPDVMDYTTLPARLDTNFDKFDEFNSVRATTIKAGITWSKTAQRGLLSKPETKSVGKETQRKEKSRAFDLLDALSKSGGLTLNGCSLHIVVAATHCFDLDLLNTVVQDNINPIDRVEASGLILASTIFQTPATELVKPGHTGRIARLFEPANNVTDEFDTGILEV